MSVEHDYKRYPYHSLTIVADGREINPDLHIIDDSGNCVLVLNYRGGSFSLHLKREELLALNTKITHLIVDSEEEWHKWLEKQAALASELNPTADPKIAGRISTSPHT